MARQQQIPGTEPPRHAELDEIIEQLVELYAIKRRNAAAITALESRLMTRQFELEIDAYDYVRIDGSRWVSLANTPEPSVKLKCLGSVED